MNIRSRKKEFKSRFSEKLMDLGNITLAAFVLSQFVSDKNFSFSVFTLGIVFAIISYAVSYYISD